MDLRELQRASARIRTRAIVRFVSRYSAKTRRIHAVLQAYSAAQKATVRHA